MFKKTRIRIVVTIMSILILLWVGTLGIIYAFSYFEMKRQNEQMLKTHAEMYALTQSVVEAMPSDKPFPEGGDRVFEPGFAESPMFQLSTFYTVAVSYDGSILEIKNEPPTLYTDGDLKTLALHIINGNKDTGTEENLAFYKTDKGGYLLVTFMDNTVVNQNAMTLFRYTLIFGGLALILFFLLSIFIARKIVNPLEDSYQKQKQFISDAGHELKTPVSVVSVNAELLSREIGDNQWLSNIQHENERMGMLVGQLLELTRVENMKPQMEHVDFSHLTAGEALPFESVAFEKGLALNSNIETGICVEGNITELRQLVSILLDNAIRHSKDSGEVSLNLRREHSFAILSVINKGDEIPVEQRQKIFERFYRLDTARNGEDNHYGLGLAIAKAIASSHKGRIEVLCYNGFVEFRVHIPVL